MTHFNQDAVKQLNQSTAEKIDAKMRTVRSGRRKYERSWIWELIQNAKDKATIDFPDKKVSIKIELSDSSLKFLHNYGYFNKNNVEGLIRQMNSEDKEREIDPQESVNPTIGRFGTGFMTTHLLSENVKISGLYKDNGDFKKIAFSLDRSSQVRKGLIKSVENSFAEAEASRSSSEILINPDFSKFNTQFTYPLQEGKSLIAETGLSDLDTSLPYTLIFVEGIKEVMVSKENEEIIFEKREPRKLSEDIQLIEIVKSLNGVSTVLSFVHLSKNLTGIALPLEIIEEEIHILPLSGKLPKIFLHFPLVGTEEFHFPVIVNNPFFEPTEPRDGIYLLDDSQDLKSVTDQNYIQDARELFSILVPFAVENDWKNLFYLAKTSLPAISEEYFSKSWFKENIQEVLREQLLTAEIVQTETSRILLESARFPFGTEKKIDQLWDLLYPIYPDRLPKKADIHHWHQVIDAQWGVDLRIDLKKLIQEISNFESIENLVDQKGFSETEALKWINEVVAYIIANNEEKLLNEYAVIPNQYGVFQSKEDLWLDKGIPSQLKAVLSLLGKDWKDSLLHRSIDSFIPPIKKGQKEITLLINQLIKGSQSYSNSIEAVLLLTSLIPSSELDSKNSRSQLYGFVKDLNSNTPEMQEVDGFLQTAWEESDKWIVKDICTDIANFHDIETLATKLGKFPIGWLHEFVIFLGKTGFGSRLNDYAILPNQLGKFKKKADLFLDDEIDPILKEINEGLTGKLKTTLLHTGIFLEIENRSISTQEVARGISEEVSEIYNTDHGQNRSQETKNLFERLLKWMIDKGETVSRDLFKDLYERRNLVLRTDEENIQAIEFRQSILNNPNGHTEEDVMRFINIPKGDFIAYTTDEFEKRVEEEVNKRLGINPDPIEIDPNELIVNLGISSEEDLLKALEAFEGSTIGDALQHVSRTTDFSYVHGLILRAKENVMSHLATLPDYDISNWEEDSFTVISGIEKNGAPIKLVIRPSDGNKVIIWYPEEFEALEQTNSFAELWHDNGMNQNIYSFGKFLRRTKTNRLPV